MWNSLEVAKLVVGVLTPVGLALLGIAVTRNGKRAEAAAAQAARDLEAATWANRRAVERLVELHKDMAPLMNDLLCFFLLIGHFRELDPPKAVSCKRRLDQVFHANRHLFEESFQQRYRDFMAECFAEGQSHGQDARFRTSVDRLRVERGEAAPWQDDWNAMFEPVSNPDERRKAQRRAYELAMSAFAAQLGLAPRTGAAGER